VRGPEGLELAVDDPPVAGYGDLGAQVVLLDPDVVGRGDKDMRSLARRESPQGRYVVLCDEAASGPEVGGVREHRVTVT